MHWEHFESTHTAHLTLRGLGIHEDVHGRHSEEMQSMQVLTSISKAVAEVARNPRTTRTTKTFIFVAAELCRSYTHKVS